MWLQRSWVQTPSGTLKGHGTRTGIAAKLKPWCLRVRLPPASLSICVGWALAGPAGCKPVVRMDLGGSTPSRRTSTTENTVTWCNLAARWIVYPLVRVQIPSSSLKNDDSWRGAMMVLQRGFPSRQRGFDFRPRHCASRTDICFRGDVVSTRRGTSMSDLAAKREPWPGVMMVLQLVSHTSRHGFDSRPGH